MRPVTYLVDHLGYHGHARQVSLLAPARRAAGGDVSVFSLNGPGPLAAALREAGVPVEGRTGRQLGDLDDALALRRRLRDHRGGILHVFGLPALRSLQIVGIGLRKPPVVLSLNGRERLGWLDRRWVRQSHRIIVPHGPAADGLARQGIPPGRMAVVPPAVGLASPPPDRESLCARLGIPAGSPLYMTAGWMNRREDLFGALWAFEFLRYPNKSARLLVIGDGPGREPMEQAALGLAPDGSRVHFLGARTDAPSLLALADLVILPQWTGGANVALEALAAGRPVVAVARPDLHAVLQEGETATFAPPRIAPELARTIRRLLDDPARMDRFRGNGPAVAVARHDAKKIVQAMEMVYPP